MGIRYAPSTKGFRLRPRCAADTPMAAGMLVAAETVLFMAIAVALIVIAAIVSVRAAPDLIAGRYRRRSRRR